MSPGQSPPTIDLARTPAFRLGTLEVRPPTRELIAGGAREVLEPRVMQALVALASRQGEVVSRDDLIATCWDGRVVGDDAINGCIAKVRRLGEAHAAFTIETIPRVGYRLSGSEVAETRGSQRSLPWRWIALGAALILAVAGAGLWSMRPAPSVRVAVAHFEVLPAAPQSQALASRVRDQISQVLTARQIQVAAGPSSKGARLLVGGVVEQAGGLTRVRVHIDDARSQTVLWQRVFEGDGGAESPLPERAAAKVTDLVVSAAAVIRSSKGSIEPDALKAWILGLDGGRDGQVLEPMEFYRAFRDRAPNLSMAHSAYAQATWSASQAQTPEVARAWRAEAESEEKRALELDPKNPAPYFVLAQMGSPFDPRARQAWLLEGLKHAPNDGSLNTSEGVFLASVGRGTEGVPFIRRGLALDPLSPAKNFGSAGTLAGLGLVDEGRPLLDNARRIWPLNATELALSLTFAVDNMSPEDGLAMIDELRRTHPTFVADSEIWRQYFEALKCDCGQGAVGLGIVAATDARRMPPRYAVPALSRLGLVDSAFDVAERHQSRLTHQEIWPFFTTATAVMRQRPRFMDLAAKLGLAEYWQSTGRWPEFCAEPGLPYDCKVEADRAVKQLKKV